MSHPAVTNLAPEHFTFWQPPAGASVAVGPEQHAVPLPAMPLPLHGSELAGTPPSDAAIGQGVYDYLRQFPECPGNTCYAELLRDAYPHFISDLAAHAVMLDAKQVEPTYVLRKLTCLKILRLLEPQNRGLLLQLSHGYFELALEFSELARCRQHLREAMRFGQELLAIDAADPQALSLLAEIDFLLGDLPAATGKWRQLAALLGDPTIEERIAWRIASVGGANDQESALVDDLEAVAEAMALHAEADDDRAVVILDQLEAAGRLTATLPSADFYWLLGVCRHAVGDLGGTVTALQKALELEPDHAAAQQAMAAL